MTNAEAQFCSSDSAQEAAHEGCRGPLPSRPIDPAVVLVHGAWVDGTGWREVIALLQEKGLKVSAVQSPLSSLVDDADAVSRAISRQPNSVVLVGHCYGGTVITHVGNNRKVLALVYVAGFAPDRGESTIDAQMNYEPLACVARFEIDPGGFLYLTEDAIQECLAQDLPAAESQVLAAAQQPIRVGALLDRVTEAAWHTKPSWYLVTDEDRMISPALQRQIASRINASIFIVRAGHVPFLSKPKDTADMILEAVNSVRGKG